MACKDDADALAALYRKVFNSYPFPIYDPEFIKDTIKNNTAYFTCKDKDKIVAASSAEINPRCSYAEMTDFATLPEYRQKGIASSLLEKMENKMEIMGIKTAYTIARAISPGMNFTFANAGYIYSGTLVNNTQISGKLESMNIWYKTIAIKNNNDKTKKHFKPRPKRILV